MKYILAYLCIASFAIVVAIAHEWDIENQCKKNGNSGAAGWTISIKCEVKNDK